MKMKRPEILSPAGNFEKMRAAILYGADAVYLAGHIFGMRAAADNFSIEELGEAVKTRFGDKAEPLYERLSEYFCILESYNFISLI